MTHLSRHIPVCLVLLLTACTSLPIEGIQPGALETVAVPLQSSVTPGPAGTAEGEESLVEAVTQTPVQEDLVCNRAAPGKPVDVTIPDGMVFKPGEEFTKTWRLVNAGDCPWSENFAIVWFSGDQMGASRLLFLDEPVPPGESIDLSVDMIAPTRNGVYQSNWKMRDAEGKMFGLGPQGDAPFWVRIAVSGESTPTALSIPTKTPAPIIFQQGDVEWEAEFSLDVDSGSINSGSFDDLSFGEQDGQRLITPLQGMQMGMADKPQPLTQADCLQITLSADPVLLEELTSEVYFCYESNQGLPGTLSIIAGSEEGEPLRVEYLTWFVP